MTNTSHATNEWATFRGEKWRSKAQGTEASLKPLDGPLIDALQLDGPLRIMDLAAGGGGTSLELGERAPEGSELFAVDVSPALVEYASGRAKDAGLSTTFWISDMSTDDPPAEPFDRLLCRFGLMFFSYEPAAFTNINRWLKPGGRFAFAVWGDRNENPWLGGLNKVIAQYLEVPKPDPEGPGPFRYAQVERLVKLLEEAGFDDVEADTWRGKLPIGGGLNLDDATEFALNNFSVAEMVEEAGGGQELMDTIRAAVREHFAPFVVDGLVQTDAAIHIVTGTKH